MASTNLSTCIIYSRSKGCMRQHERERGGTGVLIYLGAPGGFAHWAPCRALPQAHWGSQGIPQTSGISIDPPINKSSIRHYNYFFAFFTSLSSNFSAIRRVSTAIQKKELSSAFIRGNVSLLILAVDKSNIQQNRNCLFDSETACLVRPHIHECYTSPSVISFSLSPSLLPPSLSLSLSFKSCL